jgi:hypothetical protein
MRTGRRVIVKSDQKAARMHMFQSLVVCAFSSQRLRIQTPADRGSYNLRRGWDSNPLAATASPHSRFK